MGYPDTALVEPATVAAHGAKVLNLHQGVDGALNPYINYPFDPKATARLADYASKAHAAGLKLKMYYTIRELSDHADELWVLRSLGDEVLSGGDGGGTAWTNEHLGGATGGYRACWQNPLSDGGFDSALCNDGLSRWANYYVEGLRWLLRPPAAIDGIYYDGVAFGADTMRRVRRVMQEEKAGCLIDLHCGNNLPGTPGNPNTYGHVQPALQFMHLFPYIDSLWFGEGYDYDAPPEYWLVEVSGLAFGLMGDMMHAGNPWRGMLYGMTTRFRCADPQPVWRLWDAFGIEAAHMVGYWEARRPVTLRCSGGATGADDADDAADAAGAGRRPAGRDEVVLATSYVRHGNATLVALASWADEPVRCALRIDYAALGLDVRYTRLRAPDVEGFQQGRAMIPLSLRRDSPPVVEVEPGRGWMLILEATPELQIVPPVPQARTRSSATPSSSSAAASASASLAWAEPSAASASSSAVAASAAPAWAAHQAKYLASSSAAAQAAALVEVAQQQQQGYHQQQDLAWSQTTP